MDKTREELITKGWVSIGFIGAIEYLGRIGEHGSIQYIPVSEGITLGIANSVQENLVTLLYNFAESKKEDTDIAVTVISHTTEETKLVSFDKPLEKWDYVEKMKNKGWELSRHDSVQAEFIKINNL